LCVIFFVIALVKQAILTISMETLVYTTASMAPPETP